MYSQSFHFTPVCVESSLAPPRSRKFSKIKNPTNFEKMPTIFTKLVKIEKLSRGKEYAITKACTIQLPLTLFERYYI